MSLASRQPFGGQAPSSKSLPSSPPLPSAQPCQVAVGRGFTTQGQLFSNSGTHCRVARVRKAEAAINTTGTGRRWGGGLQGGSTSLEATRERPLHKKTENPTSAKRHVSVRRRRELRLLLTICRDAVEFLVVLLMQTRKEGTGGIRRSPFFFISFFSALLCQRDISSGALYTRFITSKQKYYLPRLPFITRAVRRCE